MGLCALVLLAFFTASPASAQKLDVATHQMRGFIKYNKETVGNLMVWLSGYYTGEDDEAVIDFDKIAVDGQKLSAYFAQNPSMTLLTAAEIYHFKAVRGTEPGEGKRLLRTAGRPAERA